MASNDQTSERSSIRQVVAASFIGTTIEWYDFFLYGTAAALVFNKLFFPKVEPSSGTLLALAPYGVGFAARPLGGIVFGHFGDRIGRKAMLVLSLLIMGVATFLIGAMPTYAAIGIWAPIILVLLRIAQGIGVGGEWGGAVLMSVEHAPRGRRGFFGSWPQMGVPAGLLLSTTVFAVVQAVTSEAAFMAWGWRVPFLASIVLVAVGLFIRLKLMESPAFERVKETKTEAPRPIVDVVRKYPREVLIAMGMRVAENGAFYVLTVFVLAYGEDELGLSKGTMLTGVIIAAAIGLFTVPLWGALSDRIGRKPPSPLKPLLAIPTTCGSGAEATTVAVLDVPELHVKTGISHRYLRPDQAVVDPALTASLPAEVVASCGLDVICHAAESYIAKPYSQRDAPESPGDRPPYQGATPISDIWSAKALEYGGRYLRDAVAGDEEARGWMMLAASLARIGFGAAGVPLPHACAYPIAGLKHEYTPAGYPDGHAFVPHGQSVIVTAPAAFRFTFEAAPERHRHAAELLAGRPLPDAGPDTL